MKLNDKGCLAVAVVVGVFLSGTAAAQTAAASDASSQIVQSKADKSKKPKHPATRKAVKKQSEKAKQLEAAKAQAKAEREARLKAEAEAKAEQEARLKAEAEAKAQRDAEMAAQEKSLQDADALIKAGKPGDAYDLLEPMEFERSGEVRYDYLLGIAALDSGKPDKATIAFERVLAVDPNFAGARLDMARAYYQLGDLPRAKTEFEEVLKQNPPEAARTTIQKYLASIETQLHAKDNRVTGYLEAAVGHDTNVNAATSEAQIATTIGIIPLNSNQTLSTNSMKTADNYVGVNGGVNILHPVSQTVALYASADVRQRDNFKISPFNTTNLSGNAGGIFTLGKQDSLRMGLTDGNYTLGATSYYNNYGLNGEWRHVFTPANQMSIFVQQMYYRFDDSVQWGVVDNQDFNQSVLGGTWTHVMKDGLSTMFGSLFTGQEQDTNSRPDGGRNFNGIRVGGQKILNDKTELFANAGWNGGSYNKQNPFIVPTTTRHDTLSDATIGLNWHWKKQWTLRPQLAWTQNQSNISIYSFDRVDASVTVRRDFN